MKENEARIWPMIVGIDGAARVQFVDETAANLALFDKIGTGNRPVGIVPYRVDCRKFLERFLSGCGGSCQRLGKERRRLTCCEWKELVGQRTAGRGKIHPGEVDHQIDRACATNPCLVVKPPAAGDNDVVEIALCAKRRAFGLGLETIPFEHFTERNVAHLIGEFGDFHLLIGHPIARRASLKVALTSSGEGQSDGVAGSPNFSSLEALTLVADRPG